jgi:hypothetical protein
VPIAPQAIAPDNEVFVKYDEAALPQRSSMNISSVLSFWRTARCIDVAFKLASNALRPSLGCDHFHRVLAKVETGMLPAASAWAERVMCVNRDAGMLL